jgi:hypothetical protein
MSLDKIGYDAAEERDGAVHTPTHRRDQDVTAAWAGRGQVLRAWPTRGKYLANVADPGRARQRNDLPASARR